MTNQNPIRVIGTNSRLSSYGNFGTVIGRELEGDGRRNLTVTPGVLFDVIWLDYPEEGIDEIDGGNLRTVSEEAYQIEVIERRLDVDR